MKIRVHHGWKWKRFGIGFGTEYYGRGLDAWLTIGFYWIGLEVYLERNADVLDI